MRGAGKWVGVVRTPRWCRDGVFLSSLCELAESSGTQATAAAVLLFCTCDGDGDGDGDGNGDREESVWKKGGGGMGGGYRGEASGGEMFSTVGVAYLSHFAHSNEKRTEEEKNTERGSKAPINR